jgi:hypothetical protein
LRELWRCSYRIGELPILREIVLSHSEARFIFPDGVILYGEYNGTSDVMCSMMFWTQEEMKALWRNQENKSCSCGEPSEPCIAFTHYGGGFYWDASACRSCMTFEGPSMPLYYDIPTTDGQPPGVWI